MLSAEISWLSRRGAQGVYDVCQMAALDLLCCSVANMRLSGCQQASSSPFGVPCHHCIEFIAVLALHILTHLSSRSHLPFVMNPHQMLLCAQICFAVCYHNSIVNRCCHYS